MATKQPMDTRTLGIKKLGSLIKDIKIAMLTTTDEDGHLHSRPLMTQKVEFDGDLYFFTGRHSAKMYDIEHTHQVNVAYSNPDENVYVSVSGSASLVEDMKKKEELWSPLYKAWWPDGLKDPEVALLKVKVESAQYWDSPSSKIVNIVGFIKAIITKTPYKGGENEKINIPH